ncbi:MAG: methionine adenosyltransferase [Candidatus Micrarchaeota archaeon]
MRSIFVEPSCDLPIEKRMFEMVERKGIGHPDTLIDGIVETFSANLCREYMKKTGAIMHHNVDKGLICGGRTAPDYGGGKFLKPIRVILCGRAAASVGSHKVSVDEIGISTAKSFLKTHCRNLDVEEHVKFESYVSPGSADLVDVFKREQQTMPLANDTSFGVGFAPFSETEKLVLATETLLNSAEYKKKNQFIGEDIKVMGVREKDSISLTVACAFVSKHVSGLPEYKEFKERMTEDMLKEAKKHTKRKVEVSVNTGDNYEEDWVYITVTGLSCEMGDDGSVGRGNRVNGLITPCRPMTMEAAAGKNPVNHVGKIYSVLAFDIAKDIVAKHSCVKDCEVKLLSQIGVPIDHPKSADVKVVMNDGESLETHRRMLTETVDSWLADIKGTTKRIIDGKAGIYY